MSVYIFHEVLRSLNLIVQTQALMPLYIDQPYAASMEQYNCFLMSTVT